MRVVISGFVPAEGRVSILRTAHALARHVAPLLDTNDEVRLSVFGDDHVVEAQTGRRVKLEKRLLGPARLWFSRADVIHCIDNDHAYGIAPWNFRRTVVTCHDLMPFWLDPTLKSIYGSAWGRHFCRRALRNLTKCAHVVCVSAYTRQRFLEHTGADPARTSVIPQAVESHFQPLDPVDPALQDFVRRVGLSGKRVLLHVGSCLPYKNIGVLLQVLQRLRTAGRSDVLLLKIGGRYSDTDHAYIDREGLGEAIIHFPRLAEEELILAYNAADVLLWPSLFEGFGLPALEAMACGTPVVCSNGGALPEVAEGAARIHAPEDVAGMAASCEALLDDASVAAAYREAGIARAREYSWTRAARSYCAVYHQIAKRGGT